MILCYGDAASLFATLFVGVLDLDSGQLEHCNCGHNAPLIVSAQGVRTLPATGLPLAMIDDRTASAVQTKLSPSEALLVYSDGVTEALNAVDEEFGEDRLAEHSHALLTSNACAAVESIVESVDAFAIGCEQSDDMRGHTTALNRHGDAVRSTFR